MAEGTIIILVSLVLAFVGLLAALFGDRLTRISFGGVRLEAQAQREFDEVLAEILQEPTGPGKIGPGADLTPPQPGTKSGDEVRSPSVTRELALMRKYHAQGLAQSRFSFALSLVFAAIGFAVIVLAILTTDTGKPISDQSLPFSSLVSATVIEAVSALFFVQSNRAQRVMVEFFDRLRTDRRLEEALTLADRMPDALIKARMMLVLGLGLADRPITDDLMRDTMGLTENSA